jgi:hypothetical protein
VDQPADSGDQALESKRLLQKRGGLTGRPSAEYIVHVIRRDVQDGQIGPPLRDSTAQLTSVHPGHHHVGDDEVDGVGGRLHDLQRLASVTGFEGAVALGLKGSADQVSEALLVVHYKNHRPGFRGSIRRSRHSLAKCGMTR